MGVNSNKPAEGDLTREERRALDRLERRRTEAEAMARQAKTGAERVEAYRRAAAVGDDAVALGRKIKARQQAEWIDAVLREAEALETFRGDELLQTASGARQRLSPLVRLYNAGLISKERLAAGSRYGETWRRLYAGGRGEGRGCSDLDPMEGRLSDIKRLDAARGYACDNELDVGGRKVLPQGLGGDARLVTLCDDVCGGEISLREFVLGNATGALSVQRRDGETDEQAKRRVSGRQRKVAMERLQRALGLLALHYGLIKTREDDLRAA